VSSRSLPWAVVLPAIPVLLAVAIALLAPWIAPHSPTAGNLAARLKPPACRTAPSPGGCSAPTCSVATR